MRPRVILLTGAPGSGKSTLGRKISEALRIPFVARDDIRGGMSLTAGAWSDTLDVLPSGEAAVEAFLQIVEVVLRHGVSCVVEYVFRSNRPHDLDRVLAIGDAVVITAHCSDVEARLIERNGRDRLVANPAVLRAAGVSSVDEHTVAMVERMRLLQLEMMTEFPVPTLTVDTSGGYEPDFETVLGFAVG